MRWRLVRDAHRERIRLLAEILQGAGLTANLTAEDLYPDWLEHEQRQSRRRRLQWSAAGILLSCTLAGAAVAMYASNVQRHYAALRDRANHAETISAHDPEGAMKAASEAWRELRTAAKPATYLPQIRNELMQADLEVQRALFSVLSARPGYAGTLGDPLENALVAANRAGARVAIAGTRSGAHDVQFYQVNAGRLKHRAVIPWPERIQCLALGETPGQIVVASRRYIGIWASDQSEPTAIPRKVDLAAGEYSDLSCTAAAIAPNGEKAILGSSGGHLFELGMHSGELRPLLQETLGGMVNDLVFDAAGGVLYVALWRRAPALIKMALGAGIAASTPLDIGDAPRTLALDVERNVLYSGHERGIVIARSTGNGELLWQSRISDASIVDLALMPEGLVVGDERGHLTFLRRFQPDRRLIPIGMTRAVITGIGAMPALESVLVTGAGEPARLWRPDARHPLEHILQRSSNAGAGISLSKDGRKLTAFGSHQILSWTNEDNGWSSASPHSLDIPEDWRILASSPTGVHAVSAAYAVENPDSKVRLKDHSGHMRILPGMEAKIAHAKFSRSGNLLALAPFERPLRVALWDTTQPDRPPTILEGPNASVATGLAISQDDSLIAVSDLRSCIHLWRLIEPKAYLSNCDKSHMPDNLAIDPNGVLLASGSLSGRIKVYRILPDKLQEVRNLEPHRESITALSFDASGRWLASASNDGELRFWDVRTWQAIGTTRDMDDSFGREIISAPGIGRFVILTQGGRRISVWHVDMDRAAARAENLSIPLP
jgi:WD40 repeat protein